MNVAVKLFPMIVSLEFGLGVSLPKGRIVEVLSVCFMLLFIVLFFYIIFFTFSRFLMEYNLRTLMWYGLGRMRYFHMDEDFI